MKFAQYKFLIIIIIIIIIINYYYYYGYFVRGGLGWQRRFLRKTQTY